MATFESQLTDAVWYQCLLQYYIKRESQDWGELGQHQSELSLAWAMGYSLVSEEFYQVVQTRLDESGISKLSLDKARAMHQYFTLEIEGDSFTVFESERLNKSLQERQSDLILQVGYYGTEIEGILAKGYTESFNNIPVYILKEEVVYTPNIIPGMVAVINNRQIYVRESALESIFEKKWLSHFDSVHYPEFSREETLSKGIRKQVMRHLDVETKAELEAKRETFLESLKELIVFHEFGHAIIQYHTLDHKIATFSEAATTFGENIIVDLLELLADIVGEHENMMGPLYFLLSTEKHSIEEKTAMFLTYLSDAWFYDTPNTFMFGYSDLIASMMVSLLDDNGQLDAQQASTFLKEDLYPWIQTEATALFSEFYNIVSQYPYFEDRKAYWDGESEKIHKGQGQYEKDVWAYSQVLIDLVQDDETKANIHRYLDDAKQSLYTKLKKKLGMPKAKSLRDGLFDDVSRKLSIEKS
jgi:hypothetical protein